MSLPLDICRCYGTGCPVRDECLRYLENEVIGEYVWYSDDMCRDPVTCNFSNGFPYKIVAYANPSRCQGD